MKKLILLLILSLTGMILIAQAPGSFNYQAVVRDSEGNLLTNQNISLRISILQGSSAGSVIYRNELSEQ
jgi:hypothetical protein